MPTNKSPITVFSSIANIAPALRTAGVPLVEIVDKAALGGYGGTVEFDVTKLHPDSVAQLQQAEILVTEPAVLADLLQYSFSSNRRTGAAQSVDPLLPKLKWCQSTYAGVDPLFKANLSFPLPFALTRFAGVFGPPIAEWCLARIIEHERGFNLSRDDQRHHKEWAKSKDILEYRYLSDLTLTILGCGDIGICIAKAAKAFGMSVVGFSRTPKTEEPAIDEAVSDLKSAMQAGDYVVSVLPSTKDTQKMLTKDVFGFASVENGGKKPVFINVGRGDVTDTNTIISSLDSGYISAAILDVFEVEPLPPSNPLWNHPNVTVSPHVSGLTRAQDVPKLVLSQYERYLDGQPLLYTVDWSKSY